jgi:hypothetical protein
VADAVPDEDVVNVDAKAVEEAASGEQAAEAKAKPVKGEGACVMRTLAGVVGSQTR